MTRPRRQRGANLLRAPGRLPVIAQGSNFLQSEAFTMSTDVSRSGMLALALNDEERTVLLGLLEQALGETRVEVHRTHAPDFRMQVQHRKELLAKMIQKLGQSLPPSVFGSDWSRFLCRRGRRPPSRARSLPPSPAPRKRGTRARTSRRADWAEHHRSIRIVVGSVRTW